MKTLDIIFTISDIKVQNSCSYHVAEKKIPSMNGFTEGVKLEQFIFDCFPYAPSTALFEVFFLLYYIEHIKTEISMIQYLNG